jgi:pilus assembly protein Flp/PilA
LIGASRTRGAQENENHTDLKNLLIEDSGQDLIEYALVAAFLALSAVAAMAPIANKMSNEFNGIGNSL